MPRVKMTKGICAYCRQEVTRGAAIRHVADCKERRSVVDTAEAGAGKPETFYYLRVQDSHLKAFWLDLEARGSAKLKDLDKYLRAIWLECCGHLSQFSMGGFGGRTAAMTREIGAVFADGATWTHIYDYGDSSETMVQAVAVRTGNPTTKHPITLLLRNVPPEEKCMECSEVARWFCRECVSEHDQSGMLCDGHKATHPHHEYGDPLPLVNSPRLGLCGYDGPADPPY